MGSDLMNLGLSDRRAEAVALALIEYFAIPPENLIVQGYGERYLKLDTQGPSQENRRASVRRITPLTDARLVNL
ncbi:OmpA family protein [Halomonas salifodinae]|uniref:OmpA family protein n=1 Tax=Halomonas salifodinae TaxID=438745 RepID=A0ABW2ESI5_9GAMM